MQRQPSRCSTKSSDSSSVQGTSSPLVDSLLKSLAKDQQPLEARNQTTVASTEKESEPVKTSLTVESIANQVQPVPNNQVSGTSSLPPRTPIPPESLKCNILKATLEQGKNSNLVSITSTDGSGIAAKKNQHSDAATIVSVVSTFNDLYFYYVIFLVFRPASIIRIIMHPSIIVFYYFPPFYFLKLYRIIYILLLFNIFDRIAFRELTVF